VGLLDRGWEGLIGLAGFKSSMFDVVLFVVPSFDAREASLPFVKLRMTMVRGVTIAVCFISYFSEIPFLRLCSG